MKTLLSLAAHSAWNRRFVLSLVALSIALSTFLLLGIERIRADVRENFSQSVSGTDLIVEHALAVFNFCCIRCFALAMRPTISAGAAFNQLASTKR